MSEFTMLHSTQIVYLPASLSRADADSYDLVYSVTDFVTKMVEDGAYELDELPEKAVQLLQANNYYGEVMNGGHSQFMGNAFSTLKTEVLGALEACTAMGARRHIEILRELKDWATANDLFDPAATEDADVSEEDDAFLSSLDDRFYEIEDTPVLHDLAATWIRSWDNIRFIEDEKLEATREAQALINPRLVPRMIVRRIERFENDIGQVSNIGFALAVASIDGQEMFLGLGMGEIARVGGEDVLVWHLRTSQGRRLGLQQPGETLAFASNGDALPARAEAALRHPIGKARSHAIEAFAGYDLSHTIAVAAEMFLRRHHPECENRGLLRPFSLKAGLPTFVVLVKDARYRISATIKGVDVASWETQSPILSIAFPEIDAYFAETAMLATAAVK